MTIQENGFAVVALGECECCGAATPEGPTCLCDTCDAAMHAEAMEERGPDDDDDFDDDDGQSFDELEDGDWDDDDMIEDDGQPDEYTEWQDYMGGDDWDHGQYDGDGDY